MRRFNKLCESFSHHFVSFTSHASTWHQQGVTTYWQVKCEKGFIMYQVKNINFSLIKRVKLVTKKVTSSRVRLANESLLKCMKLRNAQKGKSDTLFSDSIYCFEIISFFTVAVGQAQVKGKTCRKSYLKFKQSDTKKSNIYSKVEEKVLHQY